VFPIANETGGIEGVHLRSYLKGGIHAAEAGLAESLFLVDLNTS
jgi:hypothetical protein